MQHIVIDPTDALSSALQAFVVPNTREAIEQAVEALIARLDALDGDPDLENVTGLEDAFECHWHDGPGCPIADCGEEEDDSGDTLDEHGEQNECAFLAPPIYGIDQTKGPLNEVAAIRDYQRSQLGL